MVQKKTLMSLASFMCNIKSRTFFYDDELLQLIKEFDLDYDITYGVMAKNGWIEMFSNSGDKTHFRNVWNFKDDGTPSD